MPPNDNHRPGVASRNGGKYDVSSSDNLIAFLSQLNSGSPFDTLTSTLVLDQYRRGVLPEGVIAALLASVGLQR
jgi:hypothetical protein